METLNAGSLQAIPIAFEEAEFGDVVAVTLSTLNDNRYKEFSLNGLVEFPGNKILITIKNNSSNDEVVHPGKLKIFVEKRLIAK